MEIFAPFFLCVIFLAAMYGLMRLFLYISNASARRSVFKSGMYTPKTVHTLLLAEFGAKSIFSGKYLPRKTEKGTVYDAYDHILLLNGPVVIVKLCREDGRITNTPLDETWDARIRTRSGNDRQISFTNPIAEGAKKKQALAEVFTHAGCRFPIAVEHIVIFPSRRVSFVLPRQQQIMSPPEALRFLKKANTREAFTKAQKKAIKKAISHFSKTESQIAAKSSKSRHR